VYVGDTQGDANATKDAGLEFVFASYGFGNVDEYQYKIEKIEDLLEL
jgi:phosphoglycolate phosphatase